MCFVVAFAMLCGSVSAILAFSIAFDVAMLIIGAIYHNQPLIDATVQSIENVFWPCVILGFASLVLMGISSIFEED